MTRHLTTMTVLTGRWASPPASSRRRSEGRSTVDAHRLDRLARALGLDASRRGVLASLTSGLLGVVPLWRDGDDAAAKKRRKKHKKKKGAEPPCTPNCAGKVCGDDGCGGSCGACGNGAGCVDGVCLCLSGFKACQNACIPVANCCSAVDCPVASGKFCQDGACISTPGLEDSGGVCIPAPTCLGAGSICQANEECCSEFCAGLLACASSESGEPCHVTSDCQPGLTCVGFICTA